MALTSRDENDLLLPLLSVASETDPFATFLDRLRRRIGAVSCAILIRPADAHEPVHLWAGVPLHLRAQATSVDHANLMDRVRYYGLRPGRVYSADEFDDHDPARKARRIRDMRLLGVADERVVRLLDDPALSAWLTVSSDRPCAAADSALLSSVAPFVAAALRTFAASERQKLTNAINAQSLDRAGCGWMVFDKAARVTAISPAMQVLLERLFGHPAVMGQRLRELGPGVDRSLGDAAAAFAHSGGAPARTIVLSTTPRIEAILTPARASDAGLFEAPVMVATCRHAREPANTRAGHFARLHDLPRREAELAILLADGLSLAQAGAAMDLTIETARNYSKRLFAKVGVRGQSALVRAVYESCASLA